LNVSRGSRPCAHASHRASGYKSPPNISITQDGTVKLLDFGIAKLIDRDNPSAALTQPGLGPLTPQKCGRRKQLLGQPVTTATDIYALGLVLYVCLTGTHPVPSNSSSSAELIRTRVDARTCAPPRPLQPGAGVEPRCAARGP